MAYPSEKGRPVPETVGQSPVQQGQAAAAAAGQIETATPTRQEALLEDADLLATDSAQDLPPPAYGDVYGEIRNEKDGLGTSASVTDDGRVNIRINQLNRRLSQTFIPALRQHVASEADSRPPPPPYIPPSLGGEEGVPPPPSLNVVIQVVGSRGDVQPFVALGKVLKETYGHRVRLATHPIFKSFVEENGLEFFSIGGDPSQLMAFMVKNPGLMPGFRSLVSGDVRQRRRDVADYIQGCWRSCYRAGDGLGVRATGDGRPAHEARPFVADCIIANPPSFAHIHCAEKLGIPLHIMFTMPYSPTQAFPHPLANIQSSNADPQITNYMSYAMIEVLTWQGLGDIINRFRAKCLDLDPVSLIWAPGMLQRLKVPHTYCWSPALIPKPEDWGNHISISGFYFLNLASNYTPTSELQAFLDAGPPPVYIGFGSIVLDNPDVMTELIFEAARKTGQRVLLSKGWGGMGADDLPGGIPDGVFMLGNVPHDWLFKQVSCVVHHGGAGTTAAGITAGRPTLVVPFFGDQPFWGAMVARAGAGPPPIPHRQLTADKLVEAIKFCLRPESLERAEELATKIAAERGSDVGAQSFHQYLEPDRLRCTLAPSRPASWRIKRTQVRLSTFAACTLVNANLLNFNDLKLFRSQEYETDLGPWDPVSGFATTVFGAFINMAGGVADFPSETLRIFHNPSGPSRQQPQTSMTKNTSTGETSRGEGSSTPPARQGLYQTSLDSSSEQVSINTDPSSPGSKVESSSSSAPSHRPWTLKKRGTSQSSFRSGNDTVIGEDRDMMARSGVHTSKGFGRIAKAALESPMRISVGVTKGFHNAPKLWGDDTVRPQEHVTDLKSGFIAIGKEFGYGMYDGVTGVVTQPWKGAQKEGTGGFFKGIGKGVGGLVAKPGAALFSIPAYFMKGAHNEVQKMFGNNVQTYIIASRVAQGHEEWLQSSDAQKHDVVNRWKLIQKYLKKKKSDPEEMMRDMLEAQREHSTNSREPRPNTGVTTTSAQSNPTRDPENAMPAMSDAQSPSHTTHAIPRRPVRAAASNENSPPSVRATSRGDVAEEAQVERAIQGNASELQRQSEEAAEHVVEIETLRQAMALSEAEAQRHANEAFEYEKMLKRVMAQSLGPPRRSSNDSDWETVMVRRYEENGVLEQPPSEPDKLAIRPAAMAEASSSAYDSTSYDQGHLEGTTQGAFELQQQGLQGEKTAQEKTEEEIVLEYVKKQSLLEAQHQNKGKSRATAQAIEDDEELRRALELSLQQRDNDVGSRIGEASRK